jgi:protein-glutamine gamma-glutamyltransferase
VKLAMQHRLGRLHKSSLYVVCAIAFLSIVFGGGVGPLMGAVFAIGLVGSWFVDEADWIDPSFARWWNVIILGFVGLTVLQLVATNESVIQAALRFVLLLTLIKLFGRFSARDDLQIYALSFLLLAAATTVNEGVTYGLLFALYVIAGTFSMALFHLRCEVEERDTTGAGERTPFDRQYVGVLGAISLTIFLSSMAIFFVFPRVGLGFFISQSRDEVSVTGFDESVELGGHGKVRDNPEVVMRVEFPDGRPDDYQSLHWRTKTFDRYDGKRWSQTLEDSTSTLPRQKNAYDFSYVHSEWHTDFSRDIEPRPIEIYLEPIGTSLLPRLWPTGEVRVGSETLHMPWNPNTGGVMTDEYADLRHTIENEIGVVYTLTWLGRPDPDALAEQTFSGEQSRPDPMYETLPEVSEAVTDMAARITADVETPYAKAQAVADYLQEHYSYTTDLPEVDRDRPIESFLLGTRRGHCEYFATAAALLLRAEGVPTRLVNGFLGGSWNGVGGYLAVRQGDAHSWIEVFVPNFGWTPVDPTPAADVLPTRPGATEQWYRNIQDAVRLNWMKWVIEYDLQSQIDLFKKAGKFLAPNQSMWGGDTDDDRPQADEDAGLSLRQAFFWLGLLAGCLGALYSARRASRRRSHLGVAAAVVSWPGLLALWMMWFLGFEPTWGAAGGLLGLACAAVGAIMGRLAPASAVAALTGIFAIIEQAGASAGLERRPDEGPAAYLDRLTQARPQASSDIAAFRARYLSARFGGRTPGAAQRAGLRDLAKTIAKAVRRGGSRPR